jgi:hypothetical protein
MMIAVSVFGADVIMAILAIGFRRGNTVVRMFVGDGGMALLTADFGMRGGVERNMVDPEYVPDRAGVGMTPQTITVFRGNGGQRHGQHEGRQQNHPGR